MFEQVFDKAQSEPKVRKGYCIDCGAEVELHPLCIAAAYAWNAHGNRGKEERLDNRSVARCSECSLLWQDAQHQASLKRLAISKKLFGEIREMKPRLIAFEGEDWQDEVDAWIAEQPRWFREEHAQSLANIKPAIEAKRQKANR